jgi:DMSO/TMAO reductase YedYZ molybdopterin-dependent catalytic subunit
VWIRGSSPCHDNHTIHEITRNITNVKESQMKFSTRLCILVLAIASLAIAASAQKTSTDVMLTVGGKVDHPLNLTRADLDAYPRRSVMTKSRDGKEHKYEGVAVFDLLQKAGVEFGEALHQEAAATYLLAEATDGYRVVFALPEFEAAGDRLILIADRMDGNALAATGGPLQLIATGDKGHGRWVRQVKSLTLQLAPKTH